MLILNFHAILEDEYKKKIEIWGLPGSSAVETVYFHHRGVDPGQGTKIPHAVWHGPPPPKN